jgi:hypothetical protein
MRKLSEIMPSALEQIRRHTTRDLSANKLSLEQVQEIFLLSNKMLKVIGIDSESQKESGSEETEVEEHLAIS